MSRIGIWLRRAALALVAVLVVAYVVVLILLKVKEPTLVYAAERSVVHPATDPIMQRVQLSSTEHAILDAVRIPAPRAASDGYWILFLHGNSSSIWDNVGQQHELLLRTFGYGVFAPDYRGFGRSTGTPTERGLADDAMLAWRYLTDSVQVPANHIIIVGHSLGTGVATELASHVDAGGLILIGGFTSLTDVASERYPFVPARLLMSSQFASVQKLPRVSMPVAIVHATDDRVIPFHHGVQLYRAAPIPKRFFPMRGGHVEGGFSAAGVGAALEWIRAQPPRLPTYALGMK